MVDTMGSLESAREVREAFDAVSDQPVVAIVYTHYHPDHTLGAAAFLDSEDVQVFAHEETGPAIYKLVTVVRPIITSRSMRMFGRYLGDASVFNNGIGPTLDIGPESTFGIVPPNEVFSDTLEVEVAGVKMQLVHAPGETDDQLFVWLPQKKVVLAGDNFYRSFPNLYTIRGTPYRDVMEWVRSLDAMRAKSPEYLVPSHTRPISGGAHVEDALRDYRDAIQFVHDQTIRWMNQGLTPVEITRRVELPPHLSSSPYLQEFYGRVDWSVRSVYNGYLGYFDGNPTGLAPFTLAEEAPRVAELAGGWDALRKKTVQAQQAGDHQWVLRLTDYLLAHDPDDSEARTLRIASLKSLGTAQVNPNARHYYLTQLFHVLIVLRDIFKPGVPVCPVRALDMGCRPDVQGRIEATCGNLHVFFVRRFLRHGRAAYSTKTIRESSLWQRKCHQFFGSGEPQQLRVRREEVRGMSAAGGFATPGAMAEDELLENARDFESDGATEARSGMLIVHDFSGEGGRLSTGLPT